MISTIRVSSIGLGVEIFVLLIAFLLRRHELKRPPTQRRQLFVELTRESILFLLALLFLTLSSLFTSIVSLFLR